MSDQPKQDPTLSISADQAKLAGALPEVTNSIADPAVTTGADYATITENTPKPNSVRYELGAEIARGGMGAVFRAIDTVFGREVAVKVLQEKYSPTSGAARRFADEARISGQLQHPNIPAVFDLGTLPDGRPFLAMKLIKGETLDDLLKGRTGPADDRGRFVAVFEQVCQAVAYAHAHQVIHRDLKPGNVMVGAFGEVQVMDWGLAKVLGTREAEHTDPDATAAPTAIQSMRETDSAFTQAGSVLGTPAYMPPEQAVGAIHKVNQQSDVFGLGAILAVILTGKAPFAGSSAETTRLQAAQGNVEECYARLNESGAEPELVALCKRCLSKRPDDRPADAGAVAKAVAALRAAADERARQAELHREKAVVESREQRKRRNVMQWAGGLIAGVLMIGVMSTTMGLLEAKKQTDIAREQERIARTETEAKEQALAAETVARKDEQQANRELWAGLDAMTGDIVGDSLGAQEDVSEGQRKFLSTVLPLYQKLMAKAGADAVSRKRVAEAALRVGEIESRIGRKEEGAAAYRQAREMFEQLVAEFPTDPAYRANLASSHHNLGQVLKDLGKWVEAEQQHQTALAVREKLAAEFPADPAYRSALAGSHNSRGNVLRALGKRPEAEAQYRTGQTIYEKLAVEFPANSRYRYSLAGVHDNLGGLLRELEKRAEAEQQHRMGLLIYERLAAEFPANSAIQVKLTMCHNNLGYVLQDLRKRAEAEEQYQKALAIRERLVVYFPAVPEHRSQLAKIHLNLGSLLHDQKNWSEAEQQYQKAVSIYEKTVDDFPAVPEYKVHLAGSYCNLGNVTSAGGKPADSLAWYEKAIGTLHPIHEAEPRETTTRLFLRNSHWGRARAYDRLGKPAEALTEWDRAIELGANDRLLPLLRAKRVTSILNAGRVDDALLELEALRKSVSFGWPDEFLYGFACVYAAAAGASEDNQEGYAATAVQLLRDAVRRGYNDVDSLKTDKHLDPIRDRDDFKQLLSTVRETDPMPRLVK
ncbi:MAG: tetratricopeptide repeat protein [Zavarzinella sp.]